MKPALLWSWGRLLPRKLIRSSRWSERVMGKHGRQDKFLAITLFNSWRNSDFCEILRKF